MAQATPDAHADAAGDGTRSPAQPGQADATASRPTPIPEPPHRPNGQRTIPGVLIARIYEVFPLVCPICGGQMRIIACITHSADIRQILDHIGVESEPPPIAPGTWAAVVGGM